MEVPQPPVHSRPDNLTARLVTIIIHEMTACISRWRDYAASRDAQLQHLHKTCQQLEARIETQRHTINAQDERIASLEFEMSPMELSCNTVSSAAFSMSLQETRRKMSGSVIDLQSSFTGGTFENTLQETYGQTHGCGDASVEGDALAPLMALAMTAVENAAEPRVEAEEVMQSESLNPKKRHLEEYDAVLKRVRES
ncbi:hypothetical protein HER10_EVM0013350 [Colletotrichum scovillei]|uniref:uncharacterized protein n=1 Tax=Colletotrichum scovillei TaxID=1209932 RepID=UPI0015C365ED|nr:uncharacterized protein HER10_EVM0013350 [Colletotrichum scovillei]KAF4772764.1 hypothetical protein HER10_EVM0013350 [Colletotrichum scovillei]